jgi:predicted nucleic acid-binding protein
MTPLSNPGAVVIDANVFIALGAREQAKLAVAETALADYAARGWLFYAPGVIIAEVLYILCGKRQSGELDDTAYQEAIDSFLDQMKAVQPPPNGDAALIARAEQIRSGYSCRRSADGIYIALAEELSQLVTTELLTFDADLPKQAARNAPTVKVNLLPC